MKQNDRTIKNIVVVGLMAAVVFIFTYMHIDIPTPLGKTMLHLGNVMCLLAALLAAHYDSTVRIPMRNNEHARSLNLSNAAAVAVYEALRQNGFGELKTEGRLTAAP